VNSWLHFNDTTDASWCWWYYQPVVLQLVVPVLAVLQHLLAIIVLQGLPQA